MRTATVLSALVAAGLTVGTATAEAQNSATIQATATVLSALAVTSGQDLQFGNVTPGIDKTIAITDLGAGRFDIAKAASSGVTLTFMLPADLDSGTDLLPITSWTGGWNSTQDASTATVFDPSASSTSTSVTPGNNIYVYVGATVSPNAAQAAGVYSGDVTMSVVYF